MTIKQNIYIDSFACFSLQWNTHFALIKFFSIKKKMYIRHKIKDLEDKQTMLTTNNFCYNSVSKSLFLWSWFSF